MNSHLNMYSHLNYKYLAWVQFGKTMQKVGTTLVVLLAIGVTLGSPAHSQRLTFMTGPAGGTWYPLGGAVKQLLEQEIEGLKIVIRPGAGLINIKGIATGKAQLAWGNVISTVDAIHGRPPFKTKITGLCNIAAFYYQFAQIPVTDLSIKSVADFRGKALATLPRGNTTEVATRDILSIYNLTYDDLGKINFASLSDQVNMMKDGQIDGFIVASSVPAAGILDLATARRIKLLPIPDLEFQRLKQKNPGWSRAVIPSGTYTGQDQDIPTASFQMHMLANCGHVSEELAYQITSALAKRGAELSAVTAMLTDYDLSIMAKDVGVPMHPGAARFYREQGIE